VDSPDLRIIFGPRDSLDLELYCLAGGDNGIVQIYIRSNSDYLVPIDITGGEFFACWSFTRLEWADVMVRSFARWEDSGEERGEEEHNVPWAVDVFRRMLSAGPGYFPRYQSSDTAKVLTDNTLQVGTSGGFRLSSAVWRQIVVSSARYFARVEKCP
jgi:hypothetical protein